ncbi:hypothetical protein PR048_006755 [Dryococelus australis]|uniref:Uncharacterized protein n=1 Tax=Dryococelus australis TaxID=614101 RepID=A0ABQ9ID59_9NEOP|nr:hypothetical protein PR048_006755 [Dryococelus australis]
MEQRRPMTLSGTIPTCENPEVTPSGIEPGSPSWEASSLTTTPSPSRCHERVHVARREHCTPVQSPASRGDGTLVARVSVVLTALALLVLKRGKKLQAGGSLKIQPTRILPQHGVANQTQGPVTGASYSQSVFQYSHIRRTAIPFRLCNIFIYSAALPTNRSSDGCLGSCFNLHNPDTSLPRRSPPLARKEQGEEGRADENSCTIFTTPREKLYPLLNVVPLQRNPSLPHIDVQLFPLRSATGIHSPSTPAEQGKEPPVSPKTPVIEFALAFNSNPNLPKKSLAPTAPYPKTLAKIIKKTVQLAAYLSCPRVDSRSSNRWRIHCGAEKYPFGMVTIPEIVHPYLRRKIWNVAPIHSPYVPPLAGGDMSQRDPPIYIRVRPLLHGTPPPSFETCLAHALYGGGALFIGAPSIIDKPALFSYWRGEYKVCEHAPHSPCIFRALHHATHSHHARRRRSGVFTETKRSDEPVERRVAASVMSADCEHRCSEGRELLSFGETLDYFENFPDFDELITGLGSADVIIFPRIMKHLMTILETKVATTPMFYHLNNLAPWLKSIPQMTTKQKIHSCSQMSTSQMTSQMRNLQQEGEE